MLKHYYSEDYLCHLAELTTSEIKTFLVDGMLINFFVKQGAFGDVINSSPFYGSHGGFFTARNFTVLSHEAASMHEVVNWLMRGAVSSVTIIENPYCSTAEASRNSALIDILKANHNISYEIVQRLSYRKRTEYINDTDELMASYHPKTRNCVRKYLKSESNIKTYDMQSPFFEDALGWLAMEHIKAIEAKDGVAKPLSYFTDLKKKYRRDRFEIRICYLDGDPVGGLLNFKTENQIEYWTPVVTETGKKINAIYGLIHNTLEDIVGKKASFLNFGGSWVSQNDLQRFKERFGSEVREYNYHCFVRNEILTKKTSKDLLTAYPYFFVRKF